MYPIFRWQRNTLKELYSFQAVTGATLGKKKCTKRGSALVALPDLAVPSESKHDDARGV